MPINNSQQASTYAARTVMNSLIALFASAKFDPNSFQHSIDRLDVFFRRRFACLLKIEFHIDTCGLDGMQGALAERKMVWLFNSTDAMEQVKRKIDITEMLELSCKELVRPDVPPEIGTTMTMTINRQSIPSGIRSM